MSGVLSTSSQLLQRSFVQLNLSIFGRGTGAKRADEPSDIAATMSCNFDLSLCNWKPSYLPGCAAVQQAKQLSTSAVLA
jgi:hypothetical protein